MVSPASAEDIPAIVKHMTIAIYNKTPGSEAERFEKAFGIARGQLTAWGFLSAGSDTGSLTAIKLTPKGQNRNRVHSGDNVQSTAAFNRLFSKFQEKDKEGNLESEDPLPEKPPKTKPNRIPKIIKPPIKKLAPKTSPLKDRKLISKAKKPMARRVKLAKGAKRA